MRAFISFIVASTFFALSPLALAEAGSDESTKTGTPPPPALSHSHTEAAGHATPANAADPAKFYMGAAHNMRDKRIPLGLSPEMKHHQLTNMRAHMAAIQSITGLLADKKFEKAAKVAHSQLGLTEEMKQMCGMFENEDFKQLGLAFHNSGNELGKALQTKNMKKSLRALNKTIGYCVQCHEKFRQ